MRSARSPRPRWRTFPSGGRPPPVPSRPMHLTPVSRRTPLSLDDRSAARPSGLPDDDELKPKTNELLKRLGELQATLYADARYAVLVVLQARDAGGKDGTVRKVFGAVSYTHLRAHETPEQLVCR